MSAEKRTLCARALYRVAAREKKVPAASSLNGLGTGLFECGNELPVSENSGNVFTGWVFVGFTMRTLLLGDVTTRGYKLLCTEIMFCYRL